jgi:hypothetical protein
MAQANSFLREKWETLRKQPDIVFWSLSIIAALTLFSGISTFIQLAKAAHRLVVHWRNLTGWFWDWAFGWLQLDFSPTAKAQLTLVLALLFLCARAAFVAQSIPPEEIQPPRLGWNWVQNTFIVTALFAYLLQLLPVGSMAAIRTESTLSESTLGRDDYIASLACLVFFLIWFIAKLYEEWRDWRGRPLNTARYEVALRRTLARVGSGVVLLLVLNFVAVFVEQSSDLLEKLGIPPEISGV